MIPALAVSLLSVSLPAGAAQKAELIPQWNASDENQ